MRLDCDFLCSLARRLAREEHGFTLMELTAAIFLLVTGLLAVASTFDASRDLTSQSEMKESAVHRAQREIERIHSLDYAKIGHLTEPTATSGDPNDPRSRISAGNFRYDPKDNTKSEPLTVVPTDGAVEVGPTSFDDGRFRGHVWRFVSSADDAGCKAMGGTPSCPASRNYKRVTVVVQVTGLKNKLKPVWISSVISDPEDGAAGADQGPKTECLNEMGVLVECVNDLPDEVDTLYLYDTPGTHSERRGVPGDHPTHPTVAPYGGCDVFDSSGCPDPDLMDDSPIPYTDPLPQVYKYSTEIGGGYTGGLALRRDTPCTGSPSSSDNSKGHMWVTPPLSTPKTVNGKGALSLFTHTIDGVPANVTLCLALYNVPGDIGNLLNPPLPAEMGRASYTDSTWPQSMTRMSFVFTYRASNQTVAAGNRVGLRLWVSSASTADISVAYDHALYPSFVQLNRLGS